MERRRFRSTSLAGLQAELLEREHLRGADPGNRHPVRPTPRTVFALPIRLRRRRDRNGA